MKETKIARENISYIKKYKLNKISARIWKRTCLEHKQTCQRWLEFLKMLSLKCVSNKVVVEIIDKEIEDKEQAIKIYDEVGR